MPRRSTRRLSQNAIAGGTVFATAMLSTGPTPPTDALAGTPVHAQQVSNDTNREHIERMADRAAERMASLRLEADALASQERTLLVELRELEVRRQLKGAELAQLESEIDTARSDLDAAVAAITELEETAIEQRPGIEARLVELYKLGRPRYTRLLLGVDDIRSIGRAYRMVSEIAELDRRRLAEHRETLAALRTSRDDLTTRHADLAVLVADAETTRRELDRSVRRQTARVNAIDERRDLTAQLTGELQLAHQQLQASLTSLATGTNVGLRAAPLALPLRPFLGELPHPVDGPVATQFGAEQQTRFGTTIQRNGIEIAAGEGTPVVPIHDGQVAYADAFTGFGNLVIVDHGAQSYSLHGYLAALDVERGIRVDRATPLGTVGRGPTGEVALYFELRVDGQPVDPVEWLEDR